MIRSKALSNKFAYFIPLILLFLFASCGARPPSLPSTSNYQLADDIVDIEIFNQYLWKASQVEALSSSITMEFSKAGYSKTIDANAAFEIPDKLRVEILPPAIGPPMVLLVLNKGKLDLLNRNERAHYHGVANLQTIYQLLWLPFTPTQLMRWISGGIAVSKSDNIVNTAFYSRPKKDEGILQISLENGQRYNYLLNKSVEDLQINTFEIFDKGERIFVSRYLYADEDEDEVEEAKVRIPKKIESWLIKDGLMITTSFKSHKANPKWKRRTRKKLFTVKVPKAFDKRPFLTDGLGPMGEFEEE